MRRRLAFLGILVATATPAASSLLDISGGILYYKPSAGSPNNVTVSAQKKMLVVRDTTELITLGSEAMSVGWTGSGTHMVTGPASSVRDAVGIDLGTGTDVLKIEAPLTVGGDIFLGAESLLIKKALLSSTLGTISLHSHNLQIRAPVSTGGLIEIAIDGAAVERSGGLLRASRLKALGRGTVRLAGANNVGILSASLDPGSIYLVDVDDLSVGTIGGTPATIGISTGAPTQGGDVNLAAACRITVDAPIDTNSGTGGTSNIDGAVLVNAPITTGAGDITLTGLGDQGACPEAFP